MTVKAYPHTMVWVPIACSCQDPDRNPGRKVGHAQLADTGLQLLRRLRQRIKPDGFTGNARNGTWKRNTDYELEY